MPYSVWKNGEKVGETRFELCPAPRKRAGVFHPTAFGLTVLPGITAMVPALFDFGAMCKAQGVDVEDNRPEAAERAFDTFADTPEGKRLQAAASCIADLELRDSAGRTVQWESIMISDMSAIVELAGRRRRDAADQLKMLPGDPIRFMISTTLADQSSSRRPNLLGASESIGVC
jgi:hypothetical protein